MDFLDTNIEDMGICITVHNLAAATYSNNMTKCNETTVCTPLTERGGKTNFAHVQQCTPLATGLTGFHRREHNPL